ncbi:MAG: hypothetical protein Q8P56_06820 [Candidatus Uhrbacteria bacterium]|nr:hypothetical protein [Candidatus Uhrbacteria bacterium]
MLRECARAISNEEEYKNLKKYVSEYDYARFSKDSKGIILADDRRRSRFDEDDRVWILEDWLERDPNRPDWHEIARG